MMEVAAGIFMTIKLKGIPFKTQLVEQLMAIPWKNEGLKHPIASVGQTWSNNEFSIGGTSPR